MALLRERVPDEGEGRNWREKPSALQRCRRVSEGLLPCRRMGPVDGFLGLVGSKVLERADILCA